MMKCILAWWQHFCIYSFDVIKWCTSHFWFVFSFKYVHSGSIDTSFFWLTIHCTYIAGGVISI